MGVGPKSSVCPLAGYPGILPGIPAVPEKFEKKKLVFNFRPLQ